MKRQAPYADSNLNSYTASQMQHVSAQRMQHNAAMMNNFPGRPDSFSTGEEHLYKASRVEGQRQWDRDVSKVPNQTPTRAFNEGQGGNGTRSYYQGQTQDSKLGLENQANKQPRTQPHEQDMEVGYEDNPSPLTFEGLEQKFLDEIINLVKEQSDVEDAENARHREKIIEINTKYQEKLLAVRAQQASRREEFLHKESQARLQQHQQAGMSQYQSTSLQDTRGYSGTAVAAAASAGEAHRAYATGQFEPYRDRPQFLGGGRTQGTEARVPYPEGRVYNTGARYY